MPGMHPQSADWAQLGPAWVVVMAATAGAAAAWLVAITAWSTLRQVKRDSAERSRPQLAAELRTPEGSKGTRILVIRNFGSTIAHNVSVRFTPELPDPPSLNSDATVISFLKRRYGKPIPALTPGMELANVWFIGVPDSDGRYINSEPMPDLAIVTIKYEDNRGRSFSDDFTIDVGVTWDSAYTGGSNFRRTQRKEALQHLEGIRRSLDSLVWATADAANRPRPDAPPSRRSWPVGPGVPASTEPPRLERSGPADTAGRTRAPAPTLELSQPADVELPLVAESPPASELPQEVGLPTTALSEPVPPPEAFQLILDASYQTAPSSVSEPPPDHTELVMDLRRSFQDLERD